MEEPDKMWRWDGGHQLQESLAVLSGGGTGCLGPSVTAVVGGDTMWE